MTTVSINNGAPETARQGHTLKIQRKKNMKAKAKITQEQISEWLRENPEVGVLNGRFGDRYYITINGTMREIAPLYHIDRSAQTTHSEYTRAIKTLAKFATDIIEQDMSVFDNDAPTVLAQVLDGVNADIEDEVFNN